MRYGKLDLRNMDCMDLMAEYEDNHFDLAIVDPPYGIGAGKMTMGSGRHKFKQGKTWDAETPTQPYFDELQRVSERQIIWGGNYFTDYLYHTPHWILWDKQNPNLSFAEGELAWMSHGDNLRIFKHYSARVEEGGKIHPTQKAVKLYKWVLNRYAKEGDKILDTHGGSMSIAIACYYMGFDLTLSELDEDYYKAGIERIERETLEQELF